MVCTTIALTAAIFGTALLLLPAIEAAACARLVVRRSADPNKKPKT